jgi:hypothetical protein
VAAGEIAALKAAQTRLQAEVDALRALVLKMAGELGVDPGPVGERGEADGP